MPICAAIVMTTIFDPVTVEGYFQNLAHFDHLREVKIFVIPDRKAPQATYTRCTALEEKGLPISCPTIQEQESFLKRIGLPLEMIPYDSDNRRNIGYLMALDWGADFLISIDDDNYCRAAEDFFIEHAVVCRGRTNATIIDSETNWFNICSSLKFDKAGPVYPRGFPYYARHKQENHRTTDGLADIHFNAGLWLSDPDIDGVSWMVNPVRATDFSGQSVILGTKTWSPVNTQNTALRRDAVASYYFVRMGYALAGLPIDRYGDIFSGYFAQACMRHLGGALRVGTPVAEHRRNSHNYIKDALGEWAGLVIAEDLLPWLTEEARLSGNSYCDAYVSLSYELEGIMERFKGPLWTGAVRAYFQDVARWMREWAEACRKLG
jgi:Reversibly glycosylated polypeptide